jgi:hypothetical protein
MSKQVLGRVALVVGCFICGILLWIPSRTKNYRGEAQRTSCDLDPSNLGHDNLFLFPGEGPGIEYL